MTLTKLPFSVYKKKRRSLTECPGLKLPKLGKEIAQKVPGPILVIFDRKRVPFVSQKWPNLRWNRLGYLPSQVKPHKKPCLKTSEGIFHFHTWDKLHGICHHLAICICLEGSTQKIDRRDGWWWEDGVGFAAGQNFMKDTTSVLFWASVVAVREKKHCHFAGVINRSESF